MCNACTAALDHARADDFAAKMVGCLNSAAVALMLSVGHRTGLFDAMRNLPPARSHDLARAAGLNERYVREWLGAMVTANIVTYDPAEQTYHLPAEHAAHLTRAAGADNIAQVMQFIAVLGGVEGRIVDCFRRGGGVPYEAFERFHDVMADESHLTVVGALDEHILPLVPGLESRLEAGISVLDVGCGKGRAMAHLAKRFPRSRFRGYDLCRDAIEAGRREAQAAELSNLTLETRDVSQIDDEARYDLITAFDAVHDQARPDLVLANIRRALKPGGVFLMQDIAGSSRVENNLDAPLAPFIYTISCMHCMSVSLAQGGMGLGAAWGEELAEEMLRAAGFDRIEKQRLEHDVMNAYFVAGV